VCSLHNGQGYTCEIDKDLALKNSLAFCLDGLCFIQIYMFDHTFYTTQMSSIYYFFRNEVFPASASIDAHGRFIEKTTQRL
jgi:hypothetical protein